MSDQKQELDICPFCHGLELKVIHNEYLDDYRVKCRNCGCNGPEAATEAEAAALWNSDAQLELVVCKRCDMHPIVGKFTVRTDNTLSWYVKCLECGVVGIQSRFKGRAISLWNKEQEKES